MSPVRSILILVAVIGGLAIAIATRLSFGTDITNLMPEGGAGSLADVSRRLTESELARSMVLNVGGPDTATAVAVARALAEARGAPGGAGCGPASTIFNSAVFDLSFPRRYTSASPPTDPELHDATRCARRPSARDGTCASHASLVKACGLRSALELRAILVRFSGQHTP